MTAMLDDHNLAVVTTMPAAVATGAAEFGACAIAVSALDGELVGAGVVLAAALDHDLLGAGGRRGRNRKRDNRRSNETKLLHDVLSPNRLSGNRTAKSGPCSIGRPEKL